MTSSLARLCVGAVAAMLMAGTASASDQSQARQGRDRLSAPTLAAHDMSARKRSASRPRGTSLRVNRLSRRATEAPDPNRPYYRPSPPFFPFAMDRGYF